MPLGRFFQRRQMWRLTSLADFWHVCQWLEKQRKSGKKAQSQALEVYLVQMTRHLRNGVDRYWQCVQQLDERSGGLISSPKTAARAKLPAGVSLTADLQRRHGELLEWLDKLLSGPPAQLATAWMVQLDNPAHFRTILTRIVQQYGNFEIIVTALPGTGAITIEPEVQTLLREMFTINNRHIRMLELANDVRTCWQATPPRRSTAFFSPATDLGQVARNMLAEYLTESDPEKIAADHAKAKAKGKAPHKYRFWRPADILRQMAHVDYEGAPPNRRPLPRRPYVDLKAQRVPVLCADLQRLEWALKEVFNNAIAATALISGTRQGLVAQPLPKHASAQPGPAIRLSIESRTQGKFLSRRQFVRLTMSDEGVGINEQILPHVVSWAVSTRRDGEKRPGGMEAIGGKGIGLPFARDTIEQHGGTLSITSKEGSGTVVIMEMPAPSPYA